MMRRYGGPVQVSAFPATQVNSDTGALEVRWDQVTSAVSSVDGPTFAVGIPQTETSSVPSTTFTVVGTSFPSYDEIKIGNFTFIENIHYEGTVGDIEATVESIVDAINATPGISAEIDGDDPTIFVVTLSPSVFGEYPAILVNKTNPPNMEISIGSGGRGYSENQSLLDPPETS